MRSERKRETRSCGLVYRGEGFDCYLEGSRELWRILNQGAMWSGLLCRTPAGFRVEKGLSVSAGVTPGRRKIVQLSRQQMMMAFRRGRLWGGTVGKWGDLRGISEVEVTALASGGGV